MRPAETAPPLLPNLDSFFTYTTPCVPMRRDGTSKVRISHSHSATLTAARHYSGPYANQRHANVL
jgi:hypothetical protein